jgi:hypothetical protein
MLAAIRNMLGIGGKPARERRRLPPPGRCPSIGASLVRRDVVMKVTQSPTPEFWNWLTLYGWREVRMSKNRRKYHAMPTGAFAKLAKAATQEREALCEKMLGAMAHDHSEPH